MESQKFDDITKALASGATRRTVLKGIVASVFGAAIGARTITTADAAGACRTLGDACKPGATGTQSGVCCATNSDGSASHLFCQKVAQTGADRCECDTAGGFVHCGNQCVSINCPGGGQLDTTTCACVCPTGTVHCPAPDGACVSNSCPDGQTFDTTSCQCRCSTPCSVTGQIQAPDCSCVCPTGTIVCNNACVSNTCPAGQSFNSTTCQCECPACTISGAVQAADCSCSCPAGTVECQGACVTNSCPAGQVFNASSCTCGCPANQVFCGGACHDPLTTCAGLHNKIFNIGCCNQGANPCQNPGQPSGKCKA